MAETSILQEEIEQFGKLAIENAPDLDGLHKQFLKDAGQDKRYPILSAMSAALLINWPPPG